MDEIRPETVVTLTGPELNWRQRLRALDWRQMRALFVITLDRYFAHNVARLSASLAFYTLLSLAPLLVVVIAIAGLAFGREAASGRIVWQIQDLVGRDGATVIQTLIEGANRPAAGTLATVIGVLTLFYAAGAVMAELRDALNTIWCVRAKPVTGIRQVLIMLRERTLAFAMVVGVGFLLLVSLVVSAALSAVSDYLEARLAVPASLFQSLNVAISLVVITVLFALIYKVLPDIYIEWRDVALGAVLTAIMFTAGRTLISVYLGRASFASTYGAAGSLVILLVWVYYSAQIFFLGAEFTQVYAQLYGSKPCDHIGREVRLEQKIPDTGPSPLI